MCRDQKLAYVSTMRLQFLVVFVVHRPEYNPIADLSKRR